MSGVLESERNIRQKRKVPGILWLISELLKYLFEEIRDDLVGVIFSSDCPEIVRLCGNDLSRTIQEDPPNTGVFLSQTAERLLFWF